MNPPRSVSPKKPYGWFNKDMLRHVERQIQGDRYLQTGGSILLHFFMFTAICSDNGGSPTFSVSVGEVARRCQCSRRTSQERIHQLIRMGVMLRGRSSNADVYSYTMLEMSEEGVGNGCLGGRQMTAVPCGHLPTTKNKQEKKRENEEKENEQGNGKAPRLSDAQRISAERELEEVKATIRNLEPEGHQDERDLPAGDRQQLRRLRCRRRELRVMLGRIV